MKVLESAIVHLLHGQMKISIFTDHICQVKVLTGIETREIDVNDTPMYRNSLAAQSPVVNDWVQLNVDFYADEPQSRKQKFFTKRR